MTELTGVLPGGFKCATRCDGGALVLVPEGDIDLCALGMLRTLQNAIGPDTQLVHLDLSAVPFMDSSAIRFLTDLQARCLRMGAELEISGLRPQHRQLLDLVHFRLLATA